MLSGKFLATLALAAAFGATIIAAPPAFAGWGSYPSSATDAGPGLDSPFGPLIEPPLMPQVPIFGGQYQ
ncbi:MAG TPA: hypothetical protein VH020_13085 [Stellaceae bacterium]|jgi:hypothetical protein|nr:hypothetical protein [Stellaceae bacterium]